MPSVQSADKQHFRINAQIGQPPKLSAFERPVFGLKNNLERVSDVAGQVRTNERLPMGIQPGLFAYSQNLVAKAKARAKLFWLVVFPPKKMASAPLNKRPSNLKTAAGNGRKSRLIE